MTGMGLDGIWTLVAVAQTERQATLIGEETDQADLYAWLNARDDALADATGPASGLELRIDVDDGFAERRTGTPVVPWFDAEGVLADEVLPFAGALLHAPGGAYLRPAEIASWAIPVDGRHGPAVLRYDDGDTKIADGVHRLDDRLVRTVNVVTDELYLTRIVLVYARAAP